ncbi:MAG TPA: response regulator transcription factor [Acidobacteriota bacterium]|nr:response regulator transcription factor [Acidobacteriota bacterium]
MKEERISRRRILLVEDELNIARPLQFNLEQEGYHVSAASSGKEALALLAARSFDLIILDLMLGDIDGFEVARRVRQRDQKLPIMMLTARSAAEDRVQGLELGADDYIVKPFHLKELLLRVERMLQRAGWYDDDAVSSPVVNIGGCRVDLDNLTGNGPRGPFQLTILEARLLQTLTAKPNIVFSRGELLKKVWGYHSEVETRTVDNFIVRLRKHFETEPDHPRHFKSLRGRGYMYVP